MKFEPPMKFAKLIDSAGGQIREPAAVAGSVTFDARSGEAHAWAEDGSTLLAHMVKARVVWIGAAGARIEGMEHFDGPAGRTIGPWNGNRFIEVQVSASYGRIQG